MLYVMPALQDFSMVISVPATFVLLTQTGEGMVVMLDGARFLPASCTLTRVIVQAYSSERQPFGTPFEVGLSLPLINII